MVVLAVALDQPRLKIIADHGEDRLQPVDRCFRPHVASIPCNKDRMCPQGEDTQISILGLLE